MRTTSSVESMNAAMRLLFPRHPHIYKFIDRLKVHEYSKTIDLLQAIKSDDAVIERRKKRDQRRDEKIKYLSELLATHEISAEGFLDGMMMKGWLGM